MTRRNTLVLAIVGMVMCLGLVLGAAFGDTGLDASPVSAPASAWSQPATAGADFAARQHQLRVLSDVQRMSHETSMHIINNIGGNSCLIGVDYDCY